MCTAERARDLIQELLLEAGRLMECESVDLALNLPDDDILVAARVEHLRLAASDIMAFAVAARAMLRGLNNHAATV